MTDPQTEWALQLLQSLAEAGVREALISPGSRSTPLVWAATRTPGLRCHSLVDERSAGFFALGQARLSGAPSLLICTSGTALANYYPAVIEARESALPLIVLSADRPFELQHCGAHQTIDQTRLYGAYAMFHELGTPTDDPGALLGVRRAAWQAVRTSLATPRGAVHLNFRARKPLEPAPGAAPLPALAPTRAPLSRPRPSPPEPDDVSALLDALERCEAPLLICGAAHAADAPSPELVRRFADLSGCVVCPEAVSQLRFQLGQDAGEGLVCDAYDWLLGSAQLGPLLAPDFALQLGGTPVSAVLERVVSGRARLDYAICAEGGWPDPVHGAARLLRCRADELLAAACEALSARPERARRPRLPLWRAAQRLARAALDRHVQAAFGEAASVATVCSRIPAGSVLALGNSLPPRLVDRYAAATERGIRVCSQRGASGIEGAIAGALGAATLAPAGVTLLVGDISFLHDIGSLWAASSERTQAGGEALPPIALVVLNNAGGRIFEQLPIAARNDVPLELWTTPHRLELWRAAELFGLPHAQVRDTPALERALAEAHQTPGATLIEVVVPPDGARSSQRAVSHELEPLLAELAAGLAPERA